MDLPEVRNYILTMDKVDKWAVANRNVIPYQLAHREENEKKPAPPKNMPHTMEAMANWTKKTFPEQVRLVERAGISFKEYLIINFALGAASGAASMEERGVKPPPGMFINRANVNFFNANKAKIMAMYAEFQTLMVGQK